MRKPIVQDVYTAIKHMITSQEIAPGGFLVEEKLAEALKVSRTPVRKALQMLSEEGLIDIVPNKYTVARATSQVDLISAFELSEGIDGMIAYLVAERKARGEISERDWQRLTDALDQMEHAYRQEDFQQWVSADAAFHTILNSLCGNPLLLKAHQDNLPRVNEVMWYKVSRHQKQTVSLTIHQELVAAIRDGDCERARTAAHTHRRRIIRFMKENLPQSGDDTTSAPANTQTGKRARIARP